MKIINYVQEQLALSPDLPDFSAGDNITVFYRIREGSKERVQPFRGNVLQVRGGDKNPNRTFTVRKMSGNVGVERVFPLTSPNIEKIVVHKYGKVRRARLFYLRELQGKKARIKERRVIDRK